MKTAANTVKTAAIQNADDKKDSSGCLFFMAKDERLKAKDERLKTKG